MGKILLRGYHTLRRHCWIIFLYPGKSLEIPWLQSYLRPHKPYGIIRRIVALPSSSSRTGRPLNLQLQINSLVPYLKPKSIVVAADDVTLSKPIYNPNKYANYSSSHAFQSLREWFTKERFIDVTVKNRTLPLSIAIDAAWADDHGRTLDKVVKHGR